MSGRRLHRALADRGSAQALRPCCPPRSSFSVGRIDSSNAELMRRARSGDPRPTLLSSPKPRPRDVAPGRRWYDNGPRMAGPASHADFRCRGPIEPVDWSGLSLVPSGVARRRGSCTRASASKWPTTLVGRTQAGGHPGWRRPMSTVVAMVGGRRHQHPRTLGGPFDAIPGWVDECLPGPTPPVC